MYNRRARPTLRVLREDLTSGWRFPHPQRAIEDGRLDDLHPLSEQPHPIIEKATESFGPSEENDNFVGPVLSSTRLRLLEIKQSQWRGGVWQDPETGVCWLLVAGLAKGDHQDTDDFYQIVKRGTESGDPSRWLPAEEDHLLLKRETAARLRTEWELDIQRAVYDAMRNIHAGGAYRIEIDHLIPSKGHFASIDLTVSLMRENDLSADENIEIDEIVVEISPKDIYAGTNLLWQLAMRVLISIDPPEQEWDVFGNTYSTIGEPGAWFRRVQSLSELVDSNILAVSEPGSHSHYAHQKHLAGKTISGSAVHTLCGVYFVPAQDHDSLPTCPACQARYAELPR